VPIYEYECDSCQYHFEEKQGFDDAPVANCPKCEGIAHRVFLPAPIIFKGAGFYTTDNRGNGDADSDSKSDEAREKVADKEEPKGE